jgi:GTP-binding protein
MFIDEMKFSAKAGDGGDGVERWRHDKFKPLSGPAGGNGGRGGDFFVRGVKNLSLLSKYTGSKEFKAKNGESGRNSSQYGKNGDSFYLDLPVGSRVIDIEREREYILEKEDQIEKILNGGSGGFGNEYFKSSTNRSPKQTTKGKRGEAGDFKVELTLVVDVGLVGLPNSGKSTLINALTNARSQVGHYMFTTIEPHLGDFYGFVIADVPGLIEGASEGKGLGHKFLRHISKTKMILHLVSLEDDDPISSYYTIRKELSNYSKSLEDKEEWIILTKKDLADKAKIDDVLVRIDTNKNRVFVIGVETDEGVKELADSLVTRLREG